MMDMLRRGRVLARLLGPMWGRGAFGVAHEAGIGSSGRVVPAFGRSGGTVRRSGTGPVRAFGGGGGGRGLAAVLLCAPLLACFAPEAAATPTVNISGGDITVTEGDTVTYTVTADPAPKKALTVNLRVVDYADYLDSSEEGRKTVVIPAGQKSAIYTIHTDDDDVDDDCHGFGCPKPYIRAYLRGGSGYRHGIWWPSPVKVEDDDGPVTVTLGGGGITVTEGDSVTYTVTADPAPKQDLTVNMDVVDSGDYVDLSEEGRQTVVIPAGQKSATYTIHTDDDNVDEDKPGVANRLVVYLAKGKGYRSNPRYWFASVKVMDNDVYSGGRTVGISGGGYVTVTEGASVPFTITADPAPAKDLTVNLRVYGYRDLLDSSEEGRKSVVIPAGQKSTTYTVNVRDDNVDSDDRYVQVAVLPGEDYLPVNRYCYHVVNVIDNDPLPVTISARDASIAEAGGTTEVTVSLRTERIKPVTVALSVAGATAGEHYTLTLKNSAGVTLVTSGSYSAQNPGIRFKRGVYAPGTRSSYVSGADKAVLVIEALSNSDLVERTLVFTHDANRGIDLGAGGHRASGFPLSIAIIDDDATASANSYADLIAKMVEWRNDARYKSYKSHTDRWDRALLAFGETVSDSTLTPMTAAEAQAFADRGWTRWVEVAKALQEIENSQSSGQTTTTTPAAEPELSLSAGAAVDEGTSAEFTLTADPAPEADLTVDITVAQTGDYLDAPGAGSRTVTLTAGATSTPLALATLNDATDESDGSVSVTLDAGTGYTVAAGQASATVAVRDDDEPVVGIAAGAGVTEGTSAAFTVTANPVPAAPLDVTLTVGQSGDYAATGEVGSKTVTIPTGGSVTLEVATVNDATDESDGSVSATVVTGTGYTVAASPDDTASVAVADDDATVTTDDDDAPPVNPHAALIAQMVEWRNDARYKSYKSHTDRWDRALLAFGETVADSTLTPMTAAEAQAFADRGWTRWVEVAKALQEIENSGQTTTTTSDPEVSLSGGSGVTEGTSASFTVTANPAPSAPLDVSLTVGQSGDFAAAGQTGSRQVTIPTGGSVTLEVATVNDATDEPDGSVSATVVAGTGYTVGSAGTQTVGIADDDVPAIVPELSLSAGAAVDEGGSASFTIHADAAPQADLTVDITVAQTGDYLDAPGAGSRTVTLAAGATSTTLSIATLNDTNDERDGAVSVTLDAGTGYTVAAGQASATVAVRDDDAPIPEVSIAGGGGVTEGTSVAFTVTATPAPATPLDVTLSVGQSGDFAVSGQTGSRQVTIPTSGSVTVEVATVDDATDEPDGSVSAILAAGTGYTVASPPHDTATVAVADDDEPVVGITAGSGVTEGSPASFTVTANPAPHAALTVKLTIAQSGDHAASGQTGTREVVIPTGGSTTFEVATVNDTADEPDGSVTATLAAGTGYAVAASPNDAASVAVADDDATGVPSFSVDDAEGHENEWWLRYTIRLSPASESKVSVWVHTRESSPVSARDGEDYVGMGWGTRLVFPAGTTERKLSIRLVNDSHDEGPETFEVELLAPQGGAVIADGVGVMTIVNSDPMPAAFLSRFGRTVAEQALDGIAGRMAAPRHPGVHGTFAGQALSFGEGGSPGGSVTANDNAPVGGVSHGVSLAQSDVVRVFGMRTDRFGDHGSDSSLGLGASRTMTGLEALLGSSFTATGETDGLGGSLAFWGRAAQSNFDGREGTFSLDGETTTAMLGADYARDRWLFGLALTQSAGEGGYADRGTGPQTCPEGMDESLCDGAVREGDGTVEASLTAAIPYAALRASERLKLWGAAGHGTGEVTLEPETGGALDSDLTWTMVAAGVRSDLLALPTQGSGPALALTSDALWARTSSEKTHDLAASDSDTTRLRLGLEGRYRIALEEGGSLMPKLELGARHDGGDAETGAGVELGGGLAWSDPALGLSLDLSGRTLITHASDDLEDRGFAASLSFDPDPESARGPSFALRQEVGAQATGGLDALFRADPLSERTGSGAAQSRWTAEAAWGLPAFGGRFTASPHVGLGLATGARDYTLGWRFTAAAGANAPDLSFGVKATRREGEGTAPAHAVGVELGARW